MDAQPTRMRPATPAPWKPTRAELLAAQDAAIPDLVGPGLRVLFCGINPGLYSGATGRHFARPGNRFWPTLERAGFTDRLLTPWDAAAMLHAGLGITNLVNRTTATAAELDDAELRAGRIRLTTTTERFAPRFVAVLGVTSYRIAFGRPTARIGPQDEPIGAARAWVLPNPSGLNAHYQLPRLAAIFEELRLAVEAAEAWDQQAPARAYSCHDRADQRPDRSDPPDSRSRRPDAPHGASGGTRRWRPRGRSV